MPTNDDRLAAVLVRYMNWEASGQPADDIAYLLAEVDRLTKRFDDAWADFQRQTEILVTATDDALRARLAVAIDANDRAAIMELVGGLSARLATVTAERDELEDLRLAGWKIDVNSLDFKYDKVSGFECAARVTTGAWSEYLGALIGHVFDAEGGVNFFEQDVWDGEPSDDNSRRFTVTVQRWGGLTPTARFIETNRELAALRAAHTWTPATAETMPPPGSGPWPVKTLMFLEQSDGSAYQYDFASVELVAGELRWSSRYEMWPIAMTWFAALPADAPATEGTP